MNTVRKNTETLISASKENDMEVTVVKLIICFMSRHQNAGQIHDIKMAMRFFENAEQLQFLGMAVTN
jgi:hypothetical protein